MLIHGLQKMTLVDYPEKVAAILFTGACNFRCPFCQNAALVLHPDTEEVIPDDEIFSYLKKRKGLLDGVVVTGGEPTLARDLIDYIKRLKDIGYSVKLDTNGYRPDVMAAAVESGVDYVAMDIKNSLDKYPETAGIAGFDPSLIERSVEYLAEDKVMYEFRTTVMHELHDEESFRKIAYMARHSHVYYLQSYSDAGDIINPIFSAPSAEELEAYSAILRTHIENVFIRDR